MKRVAEYPRGVLLASYMCVPDPDYEEEPQCVSSVNATFQLGDP